VFIIFHFLYGLDVFKIRAHLPVTFVVPCNKLSKLTNPQWIHVCRDLDKVATPAPF
jgi:hypothetical protein